MSENSWIRWELREIILYIFIGIMFLGVIPIFFGFGLKGFEESFSSDVIKISDYLGSYLIYIALGFIAFGCIIYSVASLISLKKGEHSATKPNPSWFRIFTVTYIFSPEQNGLLYKLSDYLGFKDNRNLMRWSKSWFRMIILGIIIFGWIAVLQISYPQLNVVGIPQGTLQQVTFGADVAFGAGIPSFTENGTLLFVFMLFMGINAYICAKYKLGLATFFIIALLIITPIVLAGWMGFHAIVYGNSDSKLFQTGVFGGVGTIITILTGTFIWWFEWHFFSNVSVKIQKLGEANTDIIFFFVIILSIITISYIFGEIYKYKSEKRKENPIA